MLRSYKLLSIFIFICVILMLVGCQKEMEIHLSPGQTLVEIVNRNHMVFEESLNVNTRSYKGMAFSQYIKDYFNNSIETLTLSTTVFDVEENEVMDAGAISLYKEGIIVDFNNYDVPDTTIYITVPGQINLLLSADPQIEYEVINDSTLKVMDWHNESTLDVVFTPGEQIQLSSLKNNYVLFDFKDINILQYQEKISVDIDGTDEKVAQTLKEWVNEQDYKDYFELQNTLKFESILTRQLISSKLLKKYNHAYILNFGKIKEETFIRVPKEMLFITENVKYTTIDDRTLLVKEGYVTIIYK